MAGTYSKKQRYLFLDVETTGLDPQKNDVIEVGAIVMEQGDQDDYPTELCRYHGKFRADYGTVDIEALAVNGRRLTEDVLTDQISSELTKELIYGFADFLADYVTNNTYIVASNVEFDIAFTNSLFNKYGIDSSNLLSTRKAIDIRQLAMVMHDRGIIDIPNNPTSVRLSWLVKELLGKEAITHTAMGDTIDLMNVYFKMRDLL